MGNARTSVSLADKIRGVFSKAQADITTTEDEFPSLCLDVYYYVEEQDDGTIGVQPLNNNFVPVGELVFISREELIASYVPEPEVYMSKVYPAIRQVAVCVEQAEGYLRKGNIYSAEYEFRNALRVDEQNIRATFGLGMVFLERGQIEKGDLVFRRLLQLKGTFEKRHKHLFNEFGIRLRKNKMYSQAIRYYSRAYALSKTDDHLLYNMARTLYETGKLKSAETFLRKALNLHADFTHARELLRIIERKFASKK